MAALSLALYALAPFARLGDVRQPADAAARSLLMFVGEYLLRYRLHPEFERGDAERRRFAPMPTVRSA